MAVEFKMEYEDADNARVRAFDAEDGSLIDDARVSTQSAEALAEATLAARDAFRGAQADGLVEGARVRVGNDPVVRTEFYGQEGTIIGTTWALSDDLKVVLFDGGTEQVVHDEYLTVVEDTEDADEAQEQALIRRLAEEGVRVTVAADATAFLKDDEDEPTGGVFFGGEIEATITEGSPSEKYCKDRNFFVVSDDGLEQVVAIRDTEPLDGYAETIADLVRDVGAQFAERRGIVPGASVNLPGMTLESLLFSTGRVLAVEDGLATVAIRDTMEQTYPAFNLTTADDDG